MIGALLLFPELHKRYESLPLYRVSALVFTAVYPVFSLMPALRGEVDGATSPLLWLPLLALIVLRYAAMVVGLASLQILVRN